MGLFVGGLFVGSAPGAGRPGTANAATLDPQSSINAANGARRERGPVAPSLQRTSVLGRREMYNDVETPSWSANPGGSCRLKPSGREDGVRGRMIAPDDVDDPLSGLVMPQLPVPRNRHVLKYIRYFGESHQGRKVFSEALRRSGRFHEIIAKVFRERGLPEDFLAVAFIESGFSTDALSTAGAAGLWQFMPATARAYGLVIESTIDERASIWRSTEAAAHHLSDLYDHFRSWELALAAYNLGYEGLERRLDDYDTDDFWTLVEAPGALPKETAHYVPKVLAAAVLFANLEEFGFDDVERAAPVDASELEVQAGTQLAVVARAAGTSLRVIRELNPELLADVVPDRGASSTLHVPRGGLSRARAMLPKLDPEGDEETTRVSEDFDWGKDDVRYGRSRLERTRRHEHGSGVGLGRRQTRRRLAERRARPRVESAENRRAAELMPERPRSVRSPVETTRVLYRVVRGDSIERIAKLVGLTVDEVLEQARVKNPSELKAGTLLDLTVPAARAPRPRARG